jgi:hypothetical protein
MSTDQEACVFLLGKDYHLGDLLWFTAVLDAYRRQRRPRSVSVVCPDRPISRILERNPLIDHLCLGELPPVWEHVGTRCGGRRVHDLRVLPLAMSMLRQWRRRRPWLYYRDLWLEPRGQWLATFLGLGKLVYAPPVLELGADDRSASTSLLRPYVVLAPHIGQYSLPLAGAVWRRIKGWPEARWARLARYLRTDGFEPVTLAAPGQTPIDGTHPLIGLPIRKAAGVIEGAAALITGESGLWFVAAATATPFVIVPWWLPRSVDWAAPTGVPYRLIYRDSASVSTVLENVRDIRRP